MASKSAAAAAGSASSASAVAASAGGAATQQHTSDERLYKYDEAAVAAMRKERPWEANVKNFQNCKVSALAAMKMLKHALAGVEKGRKAGTQPVEVMGLMIGKPDGDSIIVLDACPLPVEGFETRVVADDAQVYMTKLMDSMELRRQEGFVGWYHSHPFDVETYSHCHLSAIDVQTQTGWQLASGAWTAIVVDPLRSLAKQEPELGCYRVYPPAHNPPANECPDGQIMTDVAARTTRWGLSYHRYYQLRLSYFMSGLGSQMLEVMSKNALWVRVLGSSSILEPDNRQRFADRISKAAERLSHVDAQLVSGGGAGAGIGMGGGGGFGLALERGHRGGGGGGRRRRDGGGGGGAATDDLSKGAQACCELAIEVCKGHSSQVIKDLLFNLIQKQEAKWQAQRDAAAAAQQQPQQQQATSMQLDD